MHCIQHARMPAQLQPERMIRMRLSKVLGPGIDLLMLAILVDHLSLRQVSQHRIQFYSHCRDFLCIQHTRINAIPFSIVIGRGDIHWRILSFSHGKANGLAKYNHRHSLKHCPESAPIHCLVSIPSSLSVLAAFAPSSEGLTSLSIFRIFPSLPI